ncbi:MAG: hypothetical protein FWD17_16535, partial [Polyangiaceae bacterium]|nr:hypothetical protein [Polyangiaceae bacterium]
HVRLDESSCPFCQAALPASFRQKKPLAAAARRLNRAALYALRMSAASATAVAATACGEMSSSHPPYGAYVPEHPSPDDASLDAAYGGFVPFDASPPLRDASADDAATDDAAADADGAAADDASADAAADAPQAVALYGGFVDAALEPSDG